jgi:hypothetical protein
MYSTVLQCTVIYVYTVYRDTWGWVKTYYYHHMLRKIHIHISSYKHPLIISQL